MFVWLDEADQSKAQVIACEDNIAPEEAARRSLRAVFKLMVDVDVVRHQRVGGEGNSERFENCRERGEISGAE